MGTGVGRPAANDGHSPSASAAAPAHADGYLDPDYHAAVKHKYPQHNCPFGIFM